MIPIQLLSIPLLLLTIIILLLFSSSILAQNFLEPGEVSIIRTAYNEDGIIELVFIIKLTSFASFNDRAGEIRYKNGLPASNIRLIAPFPDTEPLLTIDYIDPINGRISFDSINFIFQWIRIDKPSAQNGRTFIAKLNINNMVIGTYTNTIRIYSFNDNDDDIFIIDIPITVIIPAEIGFNPVLLPITDTSNGNSIIQYSLLEGNSLIEQIRLRSRPIGTVIINIEYNKLFSNISGIDSGGFNYTGGGPLLAVNNNQFIFTSTNWNTPQSLIITAINNGLIQGNRWSIVNITISSSTDSNYNSVKLSLLNFTILEDDKPLIQYNPSILSYTLTEDSSEQLFNISIKSQPEYYFNGNNIGYVSFTLTQNPHYSLQPNIFLFDSLNWNSPITVRLIPIANPVIEGTRYFTITGTVTSNDYHYINYQLPIIQLTLMDRSVGFNSISPNNGRRDGGTKVDLILSGNNFDVASVGETILPTVYCLFSYNSIIPAVNSSCIIKNSISCTCIIPPCVRDPSTNLRDCYDQYNIQMLVNNQKTIVSSYNYYQYSSYMYLEPPQVNRIDPNQIDITGGTELTIEISLLSRANISVISISTIRCNIGGYIVAATKWIPSDTTTKHIIKCMAPNRADLGGSSQTIAQTVLVSFNGQDYSSSALGVAGGAQSINYYDYQRAKDVSIQAIFFVTCFMVLLTFCILLCHHYCCRNCRTRAVADEELKHRDLTGPDKLIELLEPQVSEKFAAIQDLERLEAELAAEKLLEAKNRAVRVKQLRDAHAARQIKEKEDRRQRKIAAMQAKNAGLPIPGSIELGAIADSSIVSSTDIGTGTGSGNMSPQLLTITTGTPLSIDTPLEMKGTGTGTPTAVAGAGTGTVEMTGLSSTDAAIKPKKHEKLHKKELKEKSIPITAAAADKPVKAAKKERIHSIKKDKSSRRSSKLDLLAGSDASDPTTADSSEPQTPRFPAISTVPLSVSIPISVPPVVAERAPLSSSTSYITPVTVPEITSFAAAAAEQHQYQQQQQQQQQQLESTRSRLSDSGVRQQFDSSIDPTAALESARRGSVEPEKKKKHKKDKHREKSVEPAAATATDTGTAEISRRDSSKDKKKSKKKKHGKDKTHTGTATIAADPSGTDISDDDLPLPSPQIESTGTGGAIFENALDSAAAAGDDAEPDSARDHKKHKKHKDKKKTKDSSAIDTDGGDTDAGGGGDENKKKKKKKSHK